MRALRFILSLASAFSACHNKQDHSKCTDSTKDKRIDRQIIACSQQTAPQRGVVVEQIEQFTGFGLYDRSFVNVMRELNDPTPFLRGIVAELGGKRKEVPYEQPKRRAGKTHNNWYTLYDAAMLSVTSYTKVGMRMAVFGGALLSIISVIVGLIYLILKLIYWDWFDAGQAPLLIMTCLMCSILLAFMGFLGEYISAINQRVMRRPLVVEEERINFDQQGQDVPAEEAQDGKKQKS